MPKQHRLFILCFFLFILVFLSGSVAADTFLVIPIEREITSGTSSFISRQLQLAETENVRAVIVTLDTPGGLVDATIAINRAFRSFPRPVIVLVAPSGAMAASAGAFIVLGSDLAVMSPGTSIGAAQPMGVSPGGVEPADDKTTQFLASHLRSLARETGRPPEIAERFVTENLTLDAWEAQEKEVIEMMASNLDELFSKLDGLTLEKSGQEFTLSTTDPTIVHAEMNTREKLQNFVSNPQISFLLLMLGGLGIYLGLSAPGTFVPEVLGSLAVVLAIYGLGLFSTNVAGLIFLVLGVGLMVVEVFTSGFGIFGVAGAGGLVIGAILLPHEPLMAADWYEGFRNTVLGVGIAVAILMLIIIQRVVSSRLRRKKSKGFMVPETGRTVEELNPRGRIKAQGEIWNALEADGNQVAPGETVEIVGQKGLTLIVRRKKESEEGGDY